MRPSLKFIPASAFLLASLHVYAADPSGVYVDKVQHQIVDYLADLADMHCTEKVVQQKLDKNGHVEATERSQYDYLVMMMGNGDDFALNESRRELSADRHKNLAPPMLVTNGISTALLVFHPYYRDSFDFSVGSEESLNGRPAIPVRFAHIAGRRTPLALALRNREFAVEMAGTAWLDSASGRVLRVNAHLLHEMTDVGLKSLEITVDYKPATAPGSRASANFPTQATIEVTTPRQHWRNTHIFENYRAFSTDAEQDPNVVVRQTPQPKDSDAPAAPAEKGKQ